MPEDGPESGLSESLEASARRRREKGVACLLLKWKADNVPMVIRIMKELVIEGHPPWEGSLDRPVLGDLPVGGRGGIPGSPPAPGPSSRPTGKPDPVTSIVITESLELNPEWVEIVKQALELGCSWAQEYKEAVGWEE